MKIHRVGAVVLVVMLLVGCGGGGDETDGTDAGGATQAANTETEKQLPGPKGRARESGPIQTVYVAMDGWDSAETVSILDAERRGFFEKDRLFVVTLSPVSPKLTIPDVVKGQDAIGIGHGPEAVAAMDRGAPIVVVGSVVQKPTAAFIWDRSSGIKGISDLKGKTIAIPGLSFQEAFLQKALEDEGLEISDVEVIRVDNDLVPALLGGRADAIFGGSANVEGIDLESKGMRPVVTPVSALGFPDYDELVLVARRDIAEENPQLIDGFGTATAHGAREAAAKPKPAAATLIASGESNPETKPAAKRRQVAATVGKLSSSGSVDPVRLQGLIDWMDENGMIEDDFAAEELLLPDS